MASRRWVVPPQDQWDFPWTRGDRCPCESGKPFGDCCLSPDGRPHLKLGPIHPTPPATGYAHPRCYLNRSCDCSRTISREHYISRGLISRPGLKVRGMPWQAEPVMATSADALTSKILCQRHNSALSPLDAHAQRAFLALEAAQMHATKASLSRKRFSTLISGEALELWAMKTLAGLYATGMDFKVGPYRFRDYPPPMANIADALTATSPRSLMRLEVPTDPDAHEASLGRSAVSTLPVIDEDQGRLVAVIFRLQGLGLKFHLDEGAPTPPDPRGLRPHMIDVVGPDRSSRIYVSWGDARPGQIVFLKLKPATPRQKDAWRASHQG